MMSRKFSISKHFVPELLKAWNTHEVRAVIPFYSQDYVGVDVGQSKPQHGIDELCQALQFYWAAFPDLSFLQDNIIVDGNNVALIWTAQGTHKGSFMNIPPTEKVISVKGVSMLVLSGNKVQQGTHIWDVAGLLRTLGFLPDL